MNWQEMIVAAIVTTAALALIWRARSAMGNRGGKGASGSCHDCNQCDD